MWQCSSTAGTQGTRTHSHDDCVCPYDDNYRTATPLPATTPAAAASRAPAPQPQPQFANATAVVTEFYQDITDHNYAAAWAAGGRNVSGGVGYDAWVAGYGTTESISLGTFSFRLGRFRLC